MVHINQLVITPLQWVVIIIVMVDEMWTDNGFKLRGFNFFNTNQILIEGLLKWLKIYLILCLLST